LNICSYKKQERKGKDAQTGEYVDMVKAGIIDPTKVVRLALQNAASVAGLLVTTEAMVAEKPKKETPPAMPHGGAWATWTTSNRNGQPSSCGRHLARGVGFLQSRPVKLF
jgi:hypothetical protein